MNFQTFSLDPRTFLSMPFIWQNFRSLIYLFAEFNNNVLFFLWFTLAWPIYFQTSIIAPFQGCIRLNLNKAISVSSRKTMTMQFLRITTFPIWSQLDSFQMRMTLPAELYEILIILRKAKQCFVYFIFLNKNKSKWKIYLFYVPTNLSPQWLINFVGIQKKWIQVIIIKIHEENMHEPLSQYEHLKHDFRYLWMAYAVIKKHLSFQHNWY